LNFRIRNDSIKIAKAQEKRNMTEVYLMGKEKEAKRPSEAAVEARKEYYRQWRARNRERVKEYNRSYWARKAQAAEKSGGESDGK
jgi:hypothetical protein